MSDHNIQMYFHSASVGKYIKTG